MKHLDRPLLDSQSWSSLDSDANTTFNLGGSEGSCCRSHYRGSRQPCLHAAARPHEQDSTRLYARPLFRLNRCYMWMFICFTDMQLCGVLPIVPAACQAQCRGRQCAARFSHVILVAVVDGSNDEGMAQSSGGRELQLGSEERVAIDPGCVKARPRALWTEIITAGNRRPK